MTEQLLRLTCDYCKMTAVLALPCSPETISEWIDVRVFVQAEEGLQPVVKNYCSPHCASQGVKLFEKRIVTPEPITDKVREVMRLNEKGELEEVPPPTTITEK